MVTKKETVKKETGKYVEGVGRRKTATARVRLITGGSGFIVNGKDYKEYFKTDAQRAMAAKPSVKIDLPAKTGISAVVSGSGLPSQAGAVSLGLARAILKSDAETRLPLRALGLLTRDPRMVERKKYGLHKARRAPQWAKR